MSEAGVHQEYSHLSKKMQLWVQLAAEDAYNAVLSAEGDLNKGFEPQLWDDLPKWKTEQYIRGVIWVMNSPDADAEQLHDEWVKDRRRHGWIRAGWKNEGRKEHPLLVLPYEKVPVLHKVKAPAFLESVRLSISRAGGARGQMHTDIVAHVSPVGHTYTREMFAAIDKIESLIVEYGIPREDEHLKQLWDALFVINGKIKAEHRHEDEDAVPDVAPSP